MIKKDAFGYGTFIKIECFTVAVAFEEYPAVTHEASAYIAADKINFTMGFEASTQKNTGLDVGRAGIESASLGCGIQKFPTSAIEAFFYCGTN